MKNKLREKLVGKGIMGQQGWFRETVGRSKRITYDNFLASVGPVSRRGVRRDRRFAGEQSGSD